MTDRRTDWQGGGANPYDDILAGQDRRSAGGALATAPGNPEAAARANVLARQNGLPADTIFRNLATFEQEARTKGAIRDVQSSDYMTRWFADPHNAAAAQDDTAPLRTVAGHGGFFSAIGDFARRVPDTVMGWIDAADKWVQRDTGKGYGSMTPVVAGMAAAMGNPEAQVRMPTVIRSTPGALKAGVANMASGALGYLRGTQEIAEGWDVTAGLQRRIFGGTIESAVGGLAQRGARATDDYAKSVMPQTGDWLTDQIIGGVSNVPSTALALGTGLAGRAVGFGMKGASLVGALTGGVVQGGQSYNTARDQGVAPGRAFLYANADLLTETAGEYVGELGFLRATDAGRSVLTRFLHQQLGDQLGEQFSTVTQDFSAWAFLPENRNKTLGDYFSALPEHMAATAVQTLVAGGVSNVAISTLERAANLPAFRTRQLAREAQRTRAEEAVMSSFMEAVTQSRLRERDPEAFEQFVRGIAQDTAAENVYLPAEAIRELNQDYHNDPFFSDYADQIDEALALDGDVVIPTSDVATRLAGTPSWERLREEARFSAGGMSMAELNSLETTHREHMERIGDEVAEQARAAQEAAEPRNRVYQDIRGQLANAGFAPDAADRYAQLWAANREAWGSRLGTDALTYHEANPVTFRRILPEALARIQATDGLDTVIHAMRRGSEPASGRKRLGPSLLEWLSSAGGLDDVGGDLASMGAGDWHRQAPFRRKLIRRTSAQVAEARAQGGMLGDGGGKVADLDEVLAGAISAGYFPELRRQSEIVAGVDSATYDDLPDTQVLLDAIDAELRGEPRYSEDNAADRSETEDVRRAAVELRDMLDRRGLDPDKASNADIRKAIELHQEDEYGDGSRELQQGVRGRALLSDEPGAIIDLFQGSDLSTVIHETGHVWLEELKRNAEVDGAPADVVEDWQTIRDWFAANGAPIAEDGFIPTEAHELFARSLERFAMEGKSPSSSLQRAFDAFRGWLLSIYRHVNNLRVELTPEVRGVFDRMIATQDAISEEAARQGVRALFTDAAQAGMTEAEFAAYQAATGAARTEAFDALLYRTMATIRAARTKEWKEQERNVRADVTARINARSDFQALHLLRTGRWLDNADREPMKVRLDRAWLVERFGADALSMLPKGVPPIYAEGGTDADVVAELVGYRNGDEMVRALMGLEAAQLAARAEGDKRNIRQRMIDAEVAATMDERHGDPLRDGSIEEEALAAIHNDRQGEVIASEARALGRQRGRVPTAYQLAREWAARKVAEGTVVDVASRSAIQRYARAAAKSARSAETALAEGNVDEAFRQKQAQMLNHALLVEAKKAADAVDAAVDRLARVARRATMKGVDQEYLDRAHSLLEKFDFRSRSQTAIDEQLSFAEWAAAQQANGVDVVIPPRLLDQGVHYTRMSVEELRGLDDSVKQIMHLGRMKKKLLDAKEQREFDEVVAEAVAAVEELRQRDPTNRMSPSIADKVRANIASADAALLKMETVFDWLDNGDPNGVFNRVVFRRMADAQAREKDMMADYVGRIQALLSALPKDTIKRWSEHVSVPELLNRDTGQPWDMTRDQLIAMALNVGNEGNLDKLARGYGWSPERLMAALNRELSPDEWRFVQSMWDTIETLWPDIAAMEKRLNGVEPEKVEARTFTTANGVELKGGYYPVVYDTSKDLTAEKQAAAAGDALFENIYTRATTPRGFTKARTDVARPVLLSLGVINRHVAEVVHDLTHREAVMDADRFLSDRRVVKAVRAVMGSEVQRQFRPWLQHIANEWALDRKGVEGWDRVAKTLRTHSTIIGMGYRLTTMLAQLGGYANSAEQVGSRWMASGFRAATGTPEKMAASFDFVMGKSAEVRHRMDTLERDINANIRDLQGKRGMIANVRRFAFHGIGYMDRVVVIPTWLGAYNKAMSEGMVDADAIYYADKVVRNSQGAGAAKDLASIQRGSEWMRLATMFYSYANTFYNRQRTLGREATEAVRARRASDFPALLARSWWLFAVSPLVPMLVGATIGGGGPKDDEDWGMWAFKGMFFGLFMGVPVVRDITGSLQSGFDYAFTPASRAIETALKSAKDVKRLADMDEGTHPSKRAVKNAVETVGYATRLPVGQISNAAQFVVDWANGDADPKGVGDWLEGLQTGKLKDERGRR